MSENASSAKIASGTKAASGTGTSVRACPICGKPAAAEAQPFCSKRCADVDLNRWFSGVYVVPGRDTGTDEDETPGAPAGGGEER